MEQITLIAHRALLYGPDISLENRPKQIIHAITMGFDCEIDLRVINDELWLGHDTNQYKINKLFLDEYADNLWIHAKNLEAFRWLTQTHYNFFWHQTDDFTLTSTGFIWTYPNKPLVDRSVMVLPEIHDPKFENLPKNCHGICSDYVVKIKELL